MRLPIGPGWVIAFLFLFLIVTACPEGGVDNGGRGGSGGNNDGSGVPPNCNLPTVKCGDGFVCDTQTGECLCKDADACPVDSVCDLTTGRCICSTDECCGDGYVFDHTYQTCVCMSDVCCPEGYAYDAERNRCTCATGDCCPPGYLFSETEERCLCDGDDVCGEGFVCELESGICMCLGNESCEGDAFCNDFGFCQDSAGCSSTIDCPDEYICNTETLFCERGHCTKNSDCPHGRQCRNGVCQRGCNTADDCWLGQACIDNLCRGDVCDRDVQCGFGENCIQGSCVQDTDPNCTPCTNSMGCPDNFECIGWQIEGDPQRFCARYCEEDRDCPNGYTCRDMYMGCQPFMIGPADVCSQFGLSCESVKIHNADGPTYQCGENGEPRAAGRICGPIHRRCDLIPAPGQTTRPGLGEFCRTLCKDGLVCADSGEGFACHKNCERSSCANGEECVASLNGGNMVCVELNNPSGL